MCLSMVLYVVLPQTNKQILASSTNLIDFEKKYMRSLLPDELGE